MSFARVFKESYKQLFRYPNIQLAQVDYDTYWMQKRADGKLGSLTDFQLKRVDWITQRIKIGSSVLDIGCGDGGVLFELQRRRQIVPIGIDVSNYVLEFLRSRDIQVLEMDSQDFEAIETLPVSDHVILFEVLEHTQNPERLLLAALKKAKKSVFFSFPNTGYFPYRLRLLLGSFPVQWRVHPGEHLRYWTLRDLHWWLEELKLTEHSTIHSYEGLPGLNTLLPSLFAMGFVGEIEVSQ